MQVYDKAHDLAKQIAASDDYKEYARLKQLVTADEKNKALIDEYEKLQLQAQASVMSGTEPDAETMGKLKSLGEVLQFNADVAAYLMAKYKFQTMVGDVYKIIGDACDLGLGFLKE